MVHSKLAREEVDPIEDDGEVAEPVTTVDTTKLVHLDDETPFDPTRDVTKQFTLEALAAMDGLDWDLHECSTMPGEESEPLAVERDRRNPPAAGAEMPRSAGSATGLRPHLAPLAEATHRDPLSAVRRVRRPSARRVRVVVRPWRRMRPSLVVRQAPTPFACAAGALSRANGATTVTDAGVGATTVRIDSKTEAFGIAAVAKWLAVSALLLSAVFGGARLEQARSRALANALASAPSGSVVGASPALLVDAEAMASAEGAGASTPPPAETPSTSSVASAASAPSGYRPPALDRHSGPLERAKQRLAVGDAVGALRQVDDYDRFYRRGPLAPESTSVRVEALLLQGNADAAIHLADRFLAANPKSPYAAHIRLLVEHARTP